MISAAMGTYLTRMFWTVHTSINMYRKSHKPKRTTVVSNSSIEVRFWRFRWSGSTVDQTLWWCLHGGGKREKLHLRRHQLVSTMNRLAPAFVTRVVSHTWIRLRRVATTGKIRATTDLVFTKSCLPSPIHRQSHRATLHIFTRSHFARFTYHITHIWHFGLVLTMGSVALSVVNLFATSILGLALTLYFLSLVGRLSCYQFPMSLRPSLFVLATFC